MHTSILHFIPFPSCEIPPVLKRIILIAINEIHVSNQFQVNNKNILTVASMPGKQINAVAHELQLLQSGAGVGKSISN